MENDQGTLKVSLKNYKALNKLYSKAVGKGGNGGDAVEYKGAKLLLSYLYWVLEYMEQTPNQEIKDYVKKHKIKRTRVT